MCISRHFHFFGFQSTRNKALEAILHTFNAKTYLLHAQFLKVVCIHTQVCKYKTLMEPCIDFNFNTTLCPCLQKLNS